MKRQQWRQHAFDWACRVVEHARAARRPAVTKFPGIRGSVEILTDRWGVPHIYAEDRDDLFFAQGYVTARDRLFQMDFNRLAASGRLAELFGRRPIPWRRMGVHFKGHTTVDVDRLLRAFGLRRGAEESMLVHSEESRALLRAYAAGVTFYMRRARSIEHRLLRWRPEPWTEVDCLLMVKAIAFDLNCAWRTILSSSLLAQANVPPDVLRALWPDCSITGPSITDGGRWAALARELALCGESVAALGLGGAPGVGSNAFAVSGAHTASGAALLANDPHLRLGCPSAWHEVHLVGAGLDVHGFVPPGLPGVAIGRTPHHSWGVTAACVQDLDLFLERLHPEVPDRYLTPQGWRTLFERSETIGIRNEQPEKLTVLESRHGPLIDAAVVDLQERSAISVAWTGHWPGRELDALLGMWTAKSWDEFRAALAHHVCPTYNVTYAGADGSVGYVLAGVIPKRRAGTPLRLLEGWSGEWDWQGRVPVAHVPAWRDESTPFVVTANNRIAPAEYPYELGHMFEAPWRFERISAKLEELVERGRDNPAAKITAEDLMAVQRDTHSPWGVAMRDGLLSLVGGVGSLAPESHSVRREAAEMWAHWDGRAEAESPGAAIALMTAFNTGREFVRRLAGEDAALGFVEVPALATEPIARLPALAPRLAELGIDLKAVVRWAFERSVEQCRQRMGEDVQGWSWGEVHELWCRHPLHESRMGKLFSLGPWPVGGSTDSVNRADVEAMGSFGVNVGVSLRLVVNARDRNEAATILPGGQSGDRFSRHYGDQLPLYLTGQLKPAPVDRDSIDVAFREHWWPQS